MWQVRTSLLVILLGMMGCTPSPSIDSSLQEPESDTTPHLVSVPTTPLPMNVNEYHQAAASGNASLVQQYLTKGMKVDARGANNTTALMWAASCGHLEVVNILLDAGADPTLEDQDRWTAGMSAESLGYAQIAQILDTSSCRTPVK